MEEYDKQVDNIGKPIAKGHSFMFNSSQIPRGREIAESKYLGKRKDLNDRAFFKGYLSGDLNYDGKENSSNVVDFRINYRSNLLD
jgi:hypothetical protein